MKRFLFTLTIVLASVLVLTHARASAAGEATNQLPSDSTYVVISNATASGTSFSSNTSQNFLYAPANSTNSRIEINDIGGGTIAYFAFGWIDKSGNCRDLGMFGGSGGAVNGTTRTVDPSIYDASLIATVNRNGSVYKVFCVSVVTFTQNNVIFRLYSTSESVLGVYAGPQDHIGTGFFANSNAQWSQTLSFATPCGGNQSVGTNHILLYDLDNGYSQPVGQNITVSILRFDRVTGAYQGTDSLSGDVTYSFSGYGADVYSTDGGNYAPYNNNYTWHVYPTSGTYFSDSRYELRVMGVGANNKIRIRLPYDQFNSTIQCPPPNQPPSGSISLNCVIDTSRPTGRRIDYAINRSDPNGDPIYLLGGNVGGRGIGAWSGSFTGNPGETGNALATITDNINPAVNVGGSGYSCAGNRPPVGTFSAVCSSGATLPVNRELRITMNFTDPDGGTVLTGAHPTGPPYNGAGVAGSNGSFTSPTHYASPARDNNTYTVNFYARDSQTGVWQWMGAANYLCYRPPTTPATLSCSVNSTASEMGSFQPSITVNNAYGLNGTLTYRLTVNPSSAVVAGTPQSLTRNPLTSGVYSSGNFTPVTIPSPGSYNQQGTMNMTAVVPDDMTTATCAGPLTVSNYPYFRVNQGDVISYNGSVRGFNNGAAAAPTVPYLGAVALAIRSSQGVCPTAISGCGVASQVNTGSGPGGGSAPRSLTFANSSGTWGNGFGATTNVVRLPAPSINPAGTFNASNALPGGSGEYHHTVNSMVTINASTNISNRRVTIYSTSTAGITIGGDITHAQPYASLASIPRIRIVATGNVYILPNVKQIDAEIIAGGSIYTCYNGWTLPINTATTNLYDLGCNNSLTVNGALVARNGVKLWRVNGTARSASLTEGNTGCSSATPCINIAEYINYAPELFLSDPAGTYKIDDEMRYDSVTSLPPLF